MQHAHVKFLATHILCMNETCWGMLLQLLVLYSLLFDAKLQRLGWVTFLLELMSELESTLSRQMNIILQETKIYKTSGKKKSYRYSLMFLLFLLFSSCRYQWAEPTKNMYHIISQWQRRLDELWGYCSPWWRILFVSVYVLQNACPVVGMPLSKICTLMVISIQKYFEHKSFNFSEHLVSSKHVSSKKVF